MQSDELMHLVPASLQGKEEILFGNLHELFTFHNEIFLKDLENCISTTELVALCFVQRVSGVNRYNLPNQICLVLIYRDTLSAGHFLSAVLVLLPEYTAIRAIT